MKLSKTNILKAIQYLQSDEVFEIIILKDKEVIKTIKPERYAPTKTVIEFRL